MREALLEILRAALSGEMLPGGTDGREGLVLSDPVIRHSMAGRAELAQFFHRPGRYGQYGPPDCDMPVSNISAAPAAPPMMISDI